VDDASKRKGTLRQKVSKISLGSRNKNNRSRQHLSDSSEEDESARAAIQEIHDARQRRSHFAKPENRKDIIFGPNVRK
jgi:hypothetical protein